MPTKKKPAKRKKISAKRKSTGGIAAYVRKVQNSPAVKKATATIKALEKKIIAAKKAKAAKVKIAQKKLK